MVPLSGNIKLAEYDRTFLDLSWKWLNDPEIRELTDTGLLTKQRQEEWFLSLTLSEDHKAWGIIYDNVRIGVAGLKNIENERAEYFGYIGERAFWGKGLSKQILDCVFEYARLRKIKMIWLRVLKMNTRAILSYHKYGFLFYLEELESIYMEKQVFPHGDSPDDY